MIRLLGILFLLTGLCAQGQIVTRAYTQPLKNATTRIILQQENDPVFYSDEPRSALQRVIVQRCDRLLAQLKTEPVDWTQVREGVQDVKESLDDLHRLRYDLAIPQRESPRVIVNYFSSGF
jgi:hypothetical protein